MNLTSWLRYWRVSLIDIDRQQLKPAADKLVAQGRLPMPSLALVDAQSVILAPHIGQQRGLDAHKRVNGRKRQVLCDTAGGFDVSWCTRPMPTIVGGAPATACPQPTATSLGQSSTQDANGQSLSGAFCVPGAGPGLTASRS